jgi:prolyl 4-hydroxylase
MSVGAVERLAFTLPDFTRHAWASEGARLVWEPRLERIRRAWLETEWTSVVEGVRPCALLGMAPGQLPETIPRWTLHGLSAVGLPLPTAEGHRDLVLIAVGSTADVTRVRAAWAARADDAIGQLLGYPDCCRAFFQTVWQGERAIDTTWGMASNTSAPESATVTIASDAVPLGNILWRWLGVRAVPHLPCRFDCPATLELAERLLGVAARAGFGDEVEWITEILSWPAEWSALHGIAESKTPILKITARTDATPRKYVVRWQGSRYPEEGATGLRFPYQPPARPLMTVGRSFQLGRKPPVATVPQRWYHADNGFASLADMDALQRPIVALARARLDGAGGHVLDLGCGNGALLAKICAGQPTLTPHGVDANSRALEHARILLPGLAGRFSAGDLFDCELWRGPRYALTLLMLGRLLEVERPVAQRLLETVRASSDAILVYAYPGGRSLAEMADSLALTLTDVHEGIAALLPTPPVPLEDAIDWSRLPEPATDHYDSDVILRLAATTTTRDRPQLYRRTPVADSPAVFDGQVAIRYVYRGLPEFEAFAVPHPDAPADHGSLRAAAELVRRWPAAFAQCQRLIEAIHPALDTRMADDAREIYRGSSCHSYERLFGTLWATVYCPIGLAEAIVHELAHQKLRVLGVSFEHATAIVGNDPARLYVSPIIKDRQRPMTAVLHAQYSYVHVTALDVHMLEEERDPARRKVLRGVLARNLARIEEGHETLRRHFEPGVHGREFMAGFTRWTEATMARARALIGRDGAGALPDIATGARTIVTPDREVEVLFTLASPRIVLLGNVLSADECDALIALCAPRLERSPVVGDSDGNVKVHENRTSRGAMLRRGETELIARIEARLAALARWPVEHGEGLNLLRYDIGDEYRAHFDSFDPDVPGLRQHLVSGGQRVATFILYLSAVTAGGATSFPQLGLDVMPHKGSALFFVNTDAHYLPDKRTLHAGQPVIQGVKYIANKWLRQRAC